MVGVVCLFVLVRPPMTFWLLLSGTLSSISRGGKVVSKERVIGLSRRVNSQQNGVGDESPVPPPFSQSATVLCDEPRLKDYSIQFLSEPVACCVKLVRRPFVLFCFVQEVFTFLRDACT